MAAKQKISVAALQQPDHEGFMTKQGGSWKSWKKRWFVLKKDTLYYFKTQKDQDVTGIIELSAQTTVKKSELGGKKNCFCVGGGPARRVFFMYPDSEEEMKTWMSALNKAIDKMKGGSTQTSMPNQPLGDKSKKEPKKDEPPAGSKTDVPSSGNGAGNNNGAGAMQSGVRGRLHQGKNEIAFLNAPDSKVLEFWQIWMESIPPPEEISDGASITFEVSVSADMEKLSWRSSGPQNLFIQKMVDFFWNVGAPESEIDRLNDIGAQINPSSIGSWIDMSARGGMDGGWFFPCEIQMNFAVDASDPGDPVSKVAEWTEQQNVLKCFSVGRDMGAAPPRQTEIRVELPGDLDTQIEKAASAFESFGFPPISEEFVSIVRSHPTENLSLSIITSSEGFVRIGLLYRRPSESVFNQLCDVSGAQYQKFVKFQQSFGVEGPSYVEFQYLNPGFGYGVYKEGTDVVFHYTVGIEGPQ